MNPQSLIMTILRNSVRGLLISACAVACWWSTPVRAQSPVLRLQQTLFGVTSTTPHVKSPVAISPDGQYLYLAEVNTVIALHREPATGALTVIDSISFDVANDPRPIVASALAVSPDGKFIYVVNNDADSDKDGMILRRGDMDGLLTLVGGFEANLFRAATLAFSPDGGQLYIGGEDQNGHLSTWVFERDALSGALHLQEQQPYGGEAVVVSPDGAHVYVAGTNLTALTRNPSNGALTLLESYSDNGSGWPGLTNALTSSPDGSHLYLTTDQVHLAAFARDAATGKLTLVATYQNGSNNVDGLGERSALQVSLDGKALYVVSSTNVLNNQGEIVAAASSITHFSRNPTSGALTFVQTQKNSTAGLTDLAGAYHLALSPDNLQLYIPGNGLLHFTRNASSGALTLATVQHYPFYWYSGEFGPDGIFTSPDGQHVYVAGYGESISGTTDDDTLTVYKREQTTGLLRVQQVIHGGLCYYVFGSCEGSLHAPVAGVVSPDGKFAYLVNYWDSLVVYERDLNSGVLRQVEIKEYGYNSPEGLISFWQVAVSPDGKNIYVGGAKHDVMTQSSSAAVHIFARSEITGGLTWQDSAPLSFNGATDMGNVDQLALSSDGKHLYASSNQGQHLFVFARNATTGALSVVEQWQNGTNNITTLSNVSGVALSPDGKHLYVASSSDDALTVFTRNPSTGKLTLNEIQRNGVAGVAGMKSASEVAVSHDGAYLYVTGSILTNNDPNNPKSAGALAIFARNSTTGQLTFREYQQDEIGLTNNLHGSRRVTDSPDSKQVYVSSLADQAVNVFVPGATPATTGFVRGHVSTVANLPLSRIRVTAYGDPDGDAIWTVQDYAVTNPNGDYTLAGLPVGAYRIEFDDSSFELYAGEFYTNAVTLAQATLVNVGANSLVNHIDAQLGLENASYMQGVVTDAADGHPLAGITVNLYDATGNGVNVLATTQTDSAGAYTLMASDGGFYRVEFKVNNEFEPLSYISEFYTNVATFAQATDLTLTPGATLTNINAQLSRRGMLQGNITDLHGHLLAGIQVLALQDADADGQWEERASDYTVFGVGHYQLSLLPPGPYRLYFQPEPMMGGGPYQPEFYDNVIELAQATSISVTSGVPLTINVQLASYRGEIVAGDDRIVVNEGSQAQNLQNGQKSVLANDQGVPSAILTATLLTAPQHGVLNLQNDGRFIYTHDGGETTTDLFTYRATDGITQSTVATATIAITPVNDVPQAMPDRMLVFRDNRGSLLTDGAASVLTNDSDVDNANLVAQLVTAPQRGQLTLNTNGTLVYAHNGDPETSDFFTYRASDTLAQSNVTTVTITIQPAPPAVTFIFSKTVGIAGIEPRCTTKGQMKVPVGTAVVYCYTIYNTGEVDLLTHTLIDSHLGVLLNQEHIHLAPGANFAKTVTQTLTVSTTNIATWTVSAAGTAQLSTLSEQDLRATVATAATILISGPADDQDGDTIPDNIEGASDLDHDNLPNFLDLNSDGDDLSDQAEAGADPTHPQDGNGNQVLDFLESNQGMPPDRSLFLPFIRR